MLRLDNRENARIVEMCYKNHTTLINPIIDWTDAEVWEFIREYNVPYCSLYDEGFKRLGCIGCPMGTVEHRRYEFERWPKYKELYLKAFEKMVELHGGGTARIQNSGADTPMVDKQMTHLSHGCTGTSTNDFQNFNADEWFEWWIY